jgi:hypothetical protein
VTIKRVFRYLCGTKYYAKCYQGKPKIDREVEYMDFSMSNGLENWIDEG